MSYIIDDAGEILEYLAAEGLSAGKRIGVSSADAVDFTQHEDYVRVLVGDYQEGGTPDPETYRIVALTDAIAPELGGAFIASFNQGYLEGYLEQLEKRLFG